MEQQLKRIKNKDLSKLDQRLFGSLDKVETINSTIQNLGQFQQFLLKQISQFQQKAKHKHKNKEVTEVIEQNCMTLRQSIMKVVPDDIQTSRSKLKQSVISPINGFRSTGTNGFSKFNNTQSKIHEYKLQQLLKRIQEMQFIQKRIIRQNQELKNQLDIVRIQNTKLRLESTDLEAQLNKQFQKKLKKQTSILHQQNNKLKYDCSKLLIENTKLSQKISQLMKSSQKQKDKQKLQKLFENPLVIQQKSQTTNSKLRQSVFLKKSQIKETNTQQKRKYIQGNLQSSLKQPQYKSFKDKFRYEFTSKLNKYQSSDIKMTRDIQTVRNFQQGTYITLRDQSTELNCFQSLNQKSKSAFNSIEMSRHYDVQQLDPNVPKLLKRNNSIIGKYDSNNISQQCLDTNKKRSALQSFDQNIRVRSAYQSLQKQKQVIDCQSISKKSNHDMMRKTKSNLFKQSFENKQNSPPIQSIYDTSIAKMKGLVNQQSNGQRKRNSQSKQKLKIFSMI